MKKSSWFKPLKSNKWILALAYSRKKVIDELSDNRSIQFINHAIKIILSKGQHQNYNHWISEMLNLCEWITDIKMKTNKNVISIPSNLIMNTYFNRLDYQDLFTNKLNNYSINYGLEDERDTINDEIAFNNFRQFCNEIANELSKGNMNINLIKNLVQQYLITSQNYVK